MAVTAGVRPGKMKELKKKMKELAGSLDLIIVLNIFHASPNLLYPFIQPALCPTPRNKTGAMPWRIAKDLLGYGVILPSVVAFSPLTQWNL